MLPHLSNYIKTNLYTGSPSPPLAHPSIKGHAHTGPHSPPSIYNQYSSTEHHHSHIPPTFVCLGHCKQISMRSNLVHRLGICWMPIWPNGPGMCVCLCLCLCMCLLVHVRLVFRCTLDNSSSRSVPKRHLVVRRQHPRSPTGRQRPVPARRQAAPHDDLVFRRSAGPTGC